MLGNAYKPSYSPGVFELWYNPWLHNHIPSPLNNLNTVLCPKLSHPYSSSTSTPAHCYSFFLSHPLCLSPAPAAGCRAQQRPSPHWLHEWGKDLQKSLALLRCRVPQSGDVPGMEHIHWRASFFNSPADFFKKPPLCTSLERHSSDTGHENVTDFQLEDVPWPASLQILYTLNCFKFQTRIQNSYKQHPNSLTCPKSLLRALQACCGLTWACHYNLKKRAGWLWTNPSHNPSKIHWRVNYLEMIMTEVWESQLWQQSQALLWGRRTFPLPLMDVSKLLEGKSLSPSVRDSTRVTPFPLSTWQTVGH